MPTDQFEGRHNKKKKRRWLIFTGIVIISLFFSFFFSSPEPTVAPPPEPEPQLRVVEGSVKKRGTLYQSLVEKKIPGQWVDLIISKLSPHIDFKRIKGGVYRFVTDMEGNLQKFVFEKSPTEVYSVQRESQGYVAIKEEVPLQRYLVRVGGEIRSSLFEAVNEIGEEDQLAISFADVLAWEIDFYKDVREGDRFKMVVERVYKGDQFIQYGPIHAVEYARGERVIRGVRYQDDYYDEKGNSLKKAFLKVPLQFTRISSQFSRARKHPILGGLRPHYGIDYAAPMGTPIWAVADGTVILVGWGGGFGKQVILRHKNGYRTYYGHLSGYGSGIKKGQHVTQKQVIGYVGSTGISTGPHLDYRITKDGRFRNPLKEGFPSGHPISEKDMEQFAEMRTEMMAWLTNDAINRKRLDWLPFRWNGDAFPNSKHEKSP